MKKVITYLISSAFLLVSLVSFGQTKEDVVVMKNGEKKTGKVISVGITSIKFTYSKETTEYEIDKAEINKIEFASGRTESFNQQPAAATAAPATEKNAEPAASNAEQRKNKIAVLPFEIETNDQTLSTPSMSKQVQESCINALRSQSPFQTIQDPMVTNNILTKKNLTANELSTYTPQEWAEILGVEYVVIGSYSILNKGTSTYGSGVSSYDKKKDGDKTKSTTYGSSNSYSTVNYDTHVNVSVYNDHGEQVFSDSRAPAFGGIDSYKSALKVLMKRSPFGKR
ncbi:MAG: CsgG/HfaB family protein [Agriterribacter sp.]